MAGYYVYTLAYPANMPLANVVFYVGKGTNDRLNQHEREAKSACLCRKCGVIRSIWQIGGSVQKVIRLKTDDEQQALAVERECIYHIYKTRHLVNYQHNTDRKNCLAIVPEHGYSTYEACTFCGLPQMGMTFINLAAEFKLSRSSQWNRYQKEDLLKFIRWLDTHHPGIRRTVLNY